MHADEQVPLATTAFILPPPRTSDFYNPLRVNPSRRSQTRQLLRPSLQSASKFCPSDFPEFFYPEYEYEICFAAEAWLRTRETAISPSETLRVVDIPPLQRTHKTKWQRRANFRKPEFWFVVLAGEVVSPGIRNTVARYFQRTEDILKLANLRA